MADTGRPRKHARRQITEPEDSIGSSASSGSESDVDPDPDPGRDRDRGHDHHHWGEEPQRHSSNNVNVGGTIRVGGDAHRANPANETPSSTTQSVASMSRPRRAPTATVPTHASPSITVSRSPSGSPEEKRKSIRLTVKMPASKLREVTSGSTLIRARGEPDPPRAAEVRSSTRPREKKRYAEYEEDEDEDDDGEGEEDEDDNDNDEDEEEDDPDTEMDELSDDHHEDENGDEDPDGDADMGDAPLAPPPPPPPGRYSAPAAGPRITLKTAPKPQVRQPVNPSLIVTPAPTAPFQSVEEKEMELDEDEDEDEELSELDSDAEEEELDETALGEEEEAEDDDDAEGEEDKLGVEGAGSDDEAGSGASTPDYAKMTKRQRGHQEDEGGFLALPMEPQVKKILTADEHRMRRVEMARRRKNLSEKRNEEEKMTTINKLLKRQATKKRGKAPDPATVAAASAAEGATPGSSDEDVVEKANPYFVRWINDRSGSRIAVPEEWLSKRVGRVFMGVSSDRAEGKLVQEVEC